MLETLETLEMHEMLKMILSIIKKTPRKKIDSKEKKAAKKKNFKHSAFETICAHCIVAGLRRPQKMGCYQME